MQLLISYGANINIKTSDGWTPLHSACRWGNFECVSTLLSLGSDINCQTNSLQTPLHIAVNHVTPSSEKLLQLLLMTNGINFNLKNCNGEVAVDLSSKQPYNKLLEITDPVLNVFQPSTL